jgi:putative SOS response-associated peptidase YedK
MHWGLIPYWAKDPSIGNRMINARAETLTEKPAFNHVVGSRRCIIPADGFYEWRKEGRRKVPMWVHLKSRKPFGLAGRITATFEFSDIRVRWNLDRDLPLYTPRFNIAPGHT